MSWARLDDRWWAHPKVTALEDYGPAVAMGASGLWVRALSYAAAHGRDTLTREQLRRLCPPNSRVTEYAAALVAVGLWDEVEAPKKRRGGTWRIHDFADFQAPQNDTPPATPRATPPTRPRATPPATPTTTPPATPPVSGTENIEESATPVPVPIPSRTTTSKEAVVTRAREAPPPTSDYTDGDLTAASNLFDLNRMCGEFGTDRREIRSALRKAWIDCWRERVKQDPPPATLDRVGKQAGYFERLGQDEQANPCDLAAKSIAGFFRAKRKYDRPDVEWWERDPGRWLKQPVALREKARRINDRREEAKLAKAEAEAAPPPPDLLKQIRGAS